MILLMHRLLLFSRVQKVLKLVAVELSKEQRWTAVPQPISFLHFVNMYTELEYCRLILNGAIVLVKELFQPLFQLCQGEADKVYPQSIKNL